jgi:hypothetical protein
MGWSLWFCLFDPTLSERPCTDARSKVAARRSDQPLSFSPRSADRRLVSTDQLRLPRPTNKAVNPIRRPSAGVQTHMNHNDRGTICQNAFTASMSFFRVFKINFEGFLEIACQCFSFVRHRALREFHASMLVWKTQPVVFGYKQKFLLWRTTWPRLSSLKLRFSCGKGVLAADYADYADGHKKPFDAPSA